MRDIQKLLKVAQAEAAAAKDKTAKAGELCKSYIATCRDSLSVCICRAVSLMNNASIRGCDESCDEVKGKSREPGSSAPQGWRKQGLMYVWNLEIATARSVDHQTHAPAVITT